VAGALCWSHPCRRQRGTFHLLRTAPAKLLDSTLMDLQARAACALLALSLVVALFGLQVGRVAPRQPAAVHCAGSFLLAPTGSCLREPHHRCLTSGSRTLSCWHHPRRQVFSCSKVTECGLKTFLRAGQGYNRPWRLAAAQQG